MIRVTLSGIVFWGLSTLAIVVSTPRDALATEVPFAAPAVIVPIAPGVRSVFATDLDGDGDLDTLWASENTIAWFENNGSLTPSWTAHGIFGSPNGGGAVSVVAADLDGDGDPDVLGGTPNKIAWFENRLGSIPDWMEHPVYDSPFGAGADSVVAADMDGDGDLDILAASPDTVAWYENNGASPPIFFPHTISAAVLGASAVFAVDLDGDGDTDVLWGSFLAKGWFENNGAPFPSFIQRPLDAFPPGSTIFAADVDGDGDTDVLSGSGTTIAWMENNGGPSASWIARTITTGAVSVTSVCAADLDADGDMDVVSATGPANTWYENNGASPPLWTARTIGPVFGGGGGGGVSVFAADLDGDGDTDVLSSSELGEQVTWHQNRTIHRSAKFPEQRIIATSAEYTGARSLAAADVDGDGDVDALTASELDDTIAWYANLDGAGGFGPRQVITTAADGADTVVAADLDGDGDADALAASFNDATIAWYENDGTPGGAGDWTEHIITTLISSAPFDVFAADVDGDGDLDVLFAARIGVERIAWFENLDGAGTFGPERVISNATGASTVFAADVDDDGDVDVLSAGFTLNTIFWHENDGARPPSWTPHTITTTANSLSSVFAADVDGDGDIDALSASQSNQKIAWYENDGTPGGPGEWTEHIIGTSVQSYFNMTGADVDGDGDLDALATMRPDQVVWYENLNGAGTFGPQQLISASPLLIWVAAADVDGDGDTDAITSAGTGTIAWYPNRGGQFALETTDMTPPVLSPGATSPVLRVIARHRGRLGDSDLELATLELRFVEYRGGSPLARLRALTSAEANALIEDLHVYGDTNSDGVFSIVDSAIATVGTLSLVDGRQTVTFADGDPFVQVQPGSSNMCFVVLHIAPDAPARIPNDFQVIHVTESSSTAQDRSADIPLTMEFAANVPSGVIGYPPRVVSVVPQDNALNVPVGTNVTVVFSEPVDDTTVTTSSIRLLGPGGVPVTANVALAPDGMTVTLDPVPPGGSLAFDTVYSVDVTNGVKDPAGLPAVPFTSRFVTAPSPVTGTPLPTVSDQSVLPSPPPAPPLGGLSSPADLGGSTVGPNLGFSVTPAGDLNADSLSDFVGGAPGYAPGGMTEAGAAAIYLGSNAPEPSSGSHPREVADVIFTGQAAHDRAGTSVAAGFDFNGDGLGDILIGAEQVNRSGTSHPACNDGAPCGAGKVYLIYFKPLEYDFDTNGLPDYLERSEVFVPLAQVGVTISGVVFTGALTGDQAGYAVAAGGRLEPSDARDEIVIGAPGAGGGGGRAYVVFSSPVMSGPKSLGNVGGGISGVVYVGSAGERLGSSVALPGDVTDPEGPDLAMGAPMADTTVLDAGRVYVAAAGSLPAGTVYATSIVTQVHGNQACEQLGFAIAGGGDNRASGSPQLPGGDLDLLIGAPYHDAVASPGNPCLDTTPLPNSGRVLQTTARLPGAVIVAAQVGSTVEGAIWQGVQAGGGLGWSVARLGDLSGNNLDDIGLGAPFASPGMNGAGAVYVIEGSANTGPLGTIDADQVGQNVSGGIFLGTQLGEAAGLALCAAGDLDGDGSIGSTTADDFTVGSPGWDASLGTVHQVLGTLLQQPGECTPLGCTVADLATGAVLVVPPNALAQGTRFRFQVRGLPTLPTACGAHSLSGKTLAGSSDNSRIDCGTPPCPPPGFAVRPAIEVPTQQSLERQLTQGEQLTLRYCDATFGWTAVPGGPATGPVQDNSFVEGRKAVAASGVDTLRRYGVFFDDLDHDDARDTCDCSPGDATRWNVPGPAGTLLFTGQTPASTTLTWGAPACMGGTPGALLYDTIRSTSPANFVTGALCVEANGADTTSVDAANPPAGQAFYYVVSPENGCTSAPACSDPACVQPPARDC